MPKKMTPAAAHRAAIRAELKTLAAAGKKILADEKAATKTERNTIARAERNLARISKACTRELENIRRRTAILEARLHA